MKKIVVTLTSIVEDNEAQEVKELIKDAMDTYGEMGVLFDDYEITETDN